MIMQSGVRRDAYGCPRFGCTVITNPERHAIRTVPERHPYFRLMHAISLKMRQTRIVLFQKLLSYLPRPVRILDVGGTEAYWEQVGIADESGVDITLLNIERMQVRRPHFKMVIGDGCDMSAFKDRQFDVVFSNAVIEHAGPYGRQKRMADEMRRVGKRYFLQTPNFHFPVDPHTHFPYFQCYSIAARAFLLHHFNLGFFMHVRDSAQAMELARSLRLLKKRELVRLFPGATIVAQRILGIPAIFIVYAWPPYDHSGLALKPCFERFRMKAGKNGACPGFVKSRDDR